jgi:hypothetical protein
MLDVELENIIIAGIYFLLKSMFNLTEEGTVM